MSTPSLSRERPRARVFSRRSLAFCSDMGVRQNNEDSCGFRVTADRAAALAVLSDGMGGHASGEVASNIAVETLMEAFDQSGGFPQGKSQLREAVLRAHELILSAGAADARKEGMGATVVAALLQPGAVTVCHVGDSRALQFRDNCVRRLTQDHLVVVEVLGLAENMAKHHPEGHVLSQALGVHGDLRPTVTQFDLVPGDRIVLCSDGVSEYVDERRLYQMLASSSLENLEQAITQAVKAAIQEGSKDNCSVLVAVAP